MVYYNPEARSDLEQIRIGLLQWEKIVLTIEFVQAYMDSIKTVCNKLDTLSYHANTVYPIHKRYGSKVYKYKRNPNTTWNIIYNLDRYGNVFVEKIISNYLTI
jgi:hypothetical protein